MHLIFIFFQVLPTLSRIPYVASIMEMIIISNYSYNKICDEHMVDMLLHLNIIDEFLITRFMTSRGSNVKILPTFGHIIAKIQ
jgi:hypothetical protein